MVSSFAHIIYNAKVPEKMYFKSTYSKKESYSKCKDIIVPNQSVHALKRKYADKWLHKGKHDISGALEDLNGCGYPLSVIIEGKKL